MKKVILFITVLFVDVFPFVSKAFSSSFLVLPKGIKIWDSVDRFLPFTTNIFREFLFPGIEKFLMCLEEIFFEFIYKNTRYAVDNWIPSILSDEYAGNNMRTFFLKVYYFERGA